MQSAFAGLWLRAMLTVFLCVSSTCRGPSVFGNICIVNLLDYDYKYKAEL